MTAVRLRQADEPPAGLDVMQATVCGFDLSGFSRWTEAAMARDGPRAAEAIADTLDEIFNRSVEAFRTVGISVEGFLGDGLLGVRPRSDDRGELRELERRLGAILAAEPGLGPMRIATANGRVWRGQVGGWNGQWHRLLTGEAVSACHRRLRKAAPIRELVWPEPTASQRHSKLIDAEISDNTILFARLLGSGRADAVQSVKPTIQLAQALADAHEGMLEAITHDDRGLMLRFAFRADAGWSTEVRRFADALRAIAATQDHKVAIGVCSGPVFRARISASDPQIETIHGVAVNRAAHLAKHRRGLSFEGASLGPHTAERGRGRLQAAPAGRAAEAAAIDELLRSRRLAWVSGEPGIGKSHLLGKLAGRAGHPRVALVAARPQHSLDPFWIWAQVLEGFRQTDAATDEVIMSLPRRGRSLLTELLRGRRAAPADLQSADARLAATAEAISAVLARLCGAQQGLVLLDDMQWADQHSRNLISRALHDSPGLSIVCARRSYAQEGPEQGEPGVVRLQGLDTAALGQALADAKLTEAALLDIETLSGGNPLQAIQLAMVHAETGRLVSGGPAAVLDARLTQLGPRDRAVLRLLAVADRGLLVEDVTALLVRVGVDRSTADLDGLVQRRFLGRSAAGYELTHRLMADRVLEQTPPSLSPGLHGMVARQLTAAFAAGRIIPGHGEIADHWRLSGRLGRAVLCYLRDAEQALDTGAYTATVSLLERSAPTLAVSNAWTRRALACANLALACWGIGDIGRAAREADAAVGFVDRSLSGGLAPGRLRRMLMLAGSPTELRSRARLALLRASVVRSEAGYFTGDLRAMIAGNLACARVGADLNAQAAAKGRGLSFIGLMAGLARISPLARHAYRTGQAISLGPAAAYCHASEAVWHLAFGRWTEAHERLAAARFRCGDLADPHVMEAVVTLEALSAHLRGDRERSETAFIELTERARARGNRLHEAWGLYGQAMANVQAADPERVLELVGEAEALLSQAADRQSLLICRGLAAQAALRAGRVDEALAATEQAIGLARTIPPVNFGSLEGYAVAPVAIAIASDQALAPGIRRVARDLAPQGIAVLQAFARVIPVGRPRLHRTRAAWAAAKGDGAGARRWLARARAAAGAMGMYGELRAASRELPELEQGHAVGLH